MRCAFDLIFIHKHNHYLFSCCFVPNFQWADTDSDRDRDGRLLNYECFGELMISGLLLAHTRWSWCWSWCWSWLLDLVKVDGVMHARHTTQAGHTPRLTTHTRPRGSYFIWLHTAREQCMVHRHVDGQILWYFAVVVGRRSGSRWLHVIMALLRLFCTIWRSRAINWNGKMLQ